LTAALFTAAATANAQVLPKKWCEGMRIRYFVGGAEGDAFGTIVYNGAKQAEADLGPKVEYMFSGWSEEKFVQQLREAVASKPNGIAMMGHPGDAAIMPLAEEASKAGIKMMYQNVPVPKVTAEFGGGYIGAQQAEQGRALGDYALKNGNLKAGDTAIVFGPFDQPNRGIREISTADALEKAGLKVVRIPSPVEWYSDPNLGLPIVTAAIAKNPGVKALSLTGGGIFGNASTYLQAANKKPGEVYTFGFDLSAQIVQGFKDGYIQLAADQQPFMQGYFPILSLCLQLKLGLAPISVDTGAGFVTTGNYKAAAEMASKGLR
jgi:simple sugar transport system substrate-binding protein